MRFLQITAFSAVLAIAAIAQNDHPTITVKELPPEAIPAGTCTEPRSGFIGVPKNGKERTKLTPKEIGEYVSKRLSEGYSVTLYPQTSGRIFATADCHPTEPLR